MRWLQIILSHSIFIAICAVALCWQTCLVLQTPNNYWLYIFVFFSTLCSYNFYWLLSKYAFSADKNVPAFIKRNKSYLLLFLFALCGMLFSIVNISELLSTIMVGVALTLLYSLPLWPFAAAKRLRRIGFIKTSLLAFTWAFVTVVVPASNISAPANTVLLLLMARFFFMLMLCSIFDQRDVKMDKIHGLHSLATDVSPKTLQAIMLISFLGYFVAGFLVRNHISNNWQMAAFCITALQVWVVYRLSLKKQGYIFYYFMVDGLMLFSSLLSFVAFLLSN